jgi:hypothetical protein
MHLTITVNLKPMVDTIGCKLIPKVQIQSELAAAEAEVRGG